jgi:lipid II:glycine glycyltransferase (peptidoglycan interpeptide bridge formation enzyme)
MQVVRATTPEEVHDYYVIADELYRTQGRRHPNSREFFQELWGRFSPSKEASLLLARHHGDVIGGVFLAHANGTVYYLDGASNRMGKRLQAANLLLWEAIRNAVDAGDERFDFVGSDIPRLAQFKASFGGSVHPYWCVEITYSRLAGGLRRAYPRWKAWVARWAC